MFSCTTGEKLSSSLLWWTAAGCLELYLHRKSYPQFRFFKEFTWLKTQCHTLTATFHTPISSCQTTTSRLTWPTQPFWSDDVIRERHAIRMPQGATGQQRLIPSVLPLVGDRWQRLTLPSMSRRHSHWATPATETQENATYGATKHTFQGAFQPDTKWVGEVMWGHW